jgi:HK97 family phage portal protein
MFGKKEIAALKRQISSLKGQQTKLRNKLDAQRTITKTFIQGQSNCFNVNRINSQIREGITQPYFETYIRFYQSIGPLGDAIDLISTLFSQIIPKIYDENTKEYIDNHPLLRLLQNPNTNTDYNLFSEREAGFFELTGNCFWMIDLSSIDGEPLSLSVIPPQWISQNIGGEGRVDTYIYSPPQATSVTFYRQDAARSRNIKYLSDDGKKELFILQRFNPNSSNYWNLGISKLHSIFFQLEQFRLASVHNQSILSNGGRLSGMLTTKEGFDFNLDQQQALRGELDNLYAGASNAGRMMVTSNLEWQPFGQTAKDMDFATLRIQMKEEIYNRLKIPLPLINSNALSLANMEVANTQLYDLAVLPLADRIFKILTMNVLSKYPDSENLTLTYDPATIPALMDRNIDQVTKIAALNKTTINEIRNRLDLVDYEGGDVIYQSNMMVPVQGEPEDSDTSTAPESEDVEDVDTTQ